MVGVSPTVLAMQHGSRQLRNWLDRSKLNQRQGAKLLGIHFTTLNQYLRAVRFPGRELSTRIEAITGIPVAAWSTKVGITKKRRARNADYANVGRAQTHV